jgi:hypothetical protein
MIATHSDTSTNDGLQGTSNATVLRSPATQPAEDVQIGAVRSNRPSRDAVVSFRFAGRTQFSIFHERGPLERDRRATQFGKIAVRH